MSEQAEKLEKLAKEKVLSYITERDRDFHFYQCQSGGSGYPIEECGNCMEKARLRYKLDVAMETLEFYADEESWHKKPGQSGLYNYDSVIEKSGPKRAKVAIKLISDSEEVSDE